MRKYYDRMMQKKERKPVLKKKLNTFNRAIKLLQLNFNDDKLDTFINQALTRLFEGIIAFD
jgi:hypothetical protein